MLTHSNNTAVSEVVGYIVIIGVSLFLSASIVIGFQGYIGTVSQATEDTNEQRSILTLNSEITNTITKTENINSQLQIQTSDSIQVNKSSVKLTRTSGGTTTTLFNKTYDSLVYETSSNHLVAENGGVWNIQNENGILLSEPSINYRNGDLTLSIVGSTGVEKIEPGFTTITKNGTQYSEYNETYSSNTYTLTFDSPVYKEWGEYMKSKYNDGVTVNYIDSESTTEVILKPPKLYKKSTDSVIESNGLVSITNSSTVTGNIKTNDSVEGAQNTTEITESRYIDFYPIETNVDTKISEIQSNSPSDPSPGSGTVTAGQYYVDSDLSLSDTTYDTSSGDIEIGVSGDLEVDSGSTVDVIGNSGSVEFFIRDSVSLQTPSNQASINAGSDASNIKIFSGGDSIRLDNIDYTGIIYNSPEYESITLKDTSNGSLCSQYQSCIKNSSYTGSLITGGVYVTNSTLSYDPSVESVTFDFTSSGTNEEFSYSLKEYDLDY